MERVALIPLRRLLFPGWIILAATLSGVGSSEKSGQQRTVLVVQGAPGEPEFETNFNQQVTLWKEACTATGTRWLTLGGDTSAATNDYQRLKAALEAEPKEGLGQFWLVLIGHGSFDGKEARFNLQGPDVSASELAGWLKPFRRPLAVINTSSSSAPFLNKLSGTNRVIITSTRSGNERNFSRFGQYLAEIITAEQADLDKDGQTSLLEAFLIASRRTAEWYKVAGRLATEHPLLDDNGDAVGTPADWFSGLRAVKKPKENSLVDGLLATQWHLREATAEKALTAADQQRRDSLERAVFLHREKKTQLPEEEYYRELERLLLQLAYFYESNSVPRGRTDSAPK